MADVDQLYALPLEAFIGARDAAAKELRKAGDRETAAVVAKLPKPTPAAWTANQVAREQPGLMAAMLEAGADLRAAQEAAVSGGGGRGLRDATMAERRAVDAVMTAAIAYRPAGRALSRAMTDRLRTTLHAAAGDESIREALAEGRLVDEAQAGGAWPFALEPSPPAEKPAAAKRGAAPKARATKASSDDAAAKRGAAKDNAPSKKTDDDERAEADRRAAAEREAAEQAEREAVEQEARKALEAELREARGSLRVRERVFAGAQEDAEEAKDGVNQAKAALEQAQKAAEDAVADAEAAERVLGEARNALAQARDDVARLEERLD